MLRVILHSLTCAVGGGHTRDRTRSDCGWSRWMIVNQEGLNTTVKDEVRWTKSRLSDRFVCLSLCMKERCWLIYNATFVFLKVPFDCVRFWVLFCRWTQSVCVAHLTTSHRTKRLSLSLTVVVCGVSSSACSGSVKKLSHDITLCCRMKKVVESWVQTQLGAAVFFFLPFLPSQFSVLA